MRENFPNWRENWNKRCAANCPKVGTPQIPEFPADPKGVATRVASGKVLNAIAPEAPDFDRRLGGLESLDAHRAAEAWAILKARSESSPAARVSAGGGFSYAGRNIHFGVREHAMAAC